MRPYLCRLLLTAMCLVPSRASGDQNFLEASSVELRFLQPEKCDPCLPASLQLPSGVTVRYEVRAHPDLMLSAKEVTEVQLFRRWAGWQVGGEPPWALRLHLPLEFQNRWIWRHERRMQSGNGNWLDMAVASIDGKPIGILRRGKRSRSLHIGDFVNRDAADVLAHRISQNVSYRSVNPASIVMEDPEFWASLRTECY